MYCFKCGKELPEDATVCSECGATQNIGKENANSPPINVIIKKEQYNEKAIIGFILSLSSLLLNEFIWVSIPVSIIAGIFSYIGLREIQKQGGSGKGLAVSGIVISSISLIFGIANLIRGIANMIDSWLYFKKLEELSGKVDLEL